MSKSLLRRLAMAVGIAGLTVAGGIGCSGNGGGSEIPLSQDLSKLPTPPPTSDTPSAKAANHGASSPQGKTPQDFSR